MVRKAVPQATQVEVLAACRRRCAVCFGLKRDTRVKAGQIAHLDRNASNASFDNQVFLCFKHHDQYSRTSQSKGLVSDEVRRFRQELVTWIEAHLGGEHHPMHELTVEKVALAPQRVAIREKSAGEILGNLKGITLPSRFHETVEALYLGRWPREPGWQATVHDVPRVLPGGNWHCAFKEVGSGAVVFATSVQDFSLLRPGDSVIVSGRIRDISQLDYVSIEDAIVRGDDVLRESR